MLRLESCWFREGPATSAGDVKLMLVEESRFVKVRAFLASPRQSRAGRNFFPISEEIPPLRPGISEEEW
jgi:hypothetical protein